MGIMKREMERQAERDFSVLVVITKHNGKETIRERDLCDSNWAETVRYIANGEWTDIERVHRLYTGEDVTRLIAEECSRLWDLRDEPLADWQKDFLRDNGVGKRRAVEAAE